ncbi:glycosyltransferase [Brassicibacter mesophilus]|uniref:glycosyltransferase n=1 Tax=Brassicibacter mesophilus TaxID=745119 RepID=UPI003D24B0D7
MSQNNKKIIISSSICNTDKEWLAQRISIFMRYTLQSLKNQTNQNFLALIVYDTKSKEIIESTLAKNKVLSENIRFVTPIEHYNQILESTKGYDYLYLVRLDSDDMYHKSFVQQLHDYNPKDDTQILICQKGYIYDSVNNRLAKYFHFSPQFYTLIYKVEDYIHGKRHDLGGSHGGAIKLNHEILEEPNYINHAHSNNTAIKFPKANPKVNRDIWIDNEDSGPSRPQLIGNIYEDKEETSKILEEFF